MSETVVTVRVLGASTVEVAFDEGGVRRIDLGSYLRGEIFRPLRDPVYFARVAMDAAVGTTVWPNGAKFATEFLSYGEAGPPGYYCGAGASAEDAIPVLVDGG